MAEGSKVRVVRCPKCENLLPELPDFSVYQCGGCGAVLSAKKKAPASDGFSEKSNEERGKDGCEKLESLSGEGGGSLGSASETERERDGIALGRRKERVFGERNVNLISSPSSRTENQEVLLSNDRNVREKNMNLTLDQGSPEMEIGYVDKYRRSRKNPADHWVRGDDLDLNMNRSESVNSSTEKDVGGISAKFKNSFGSLRSRAIRDQWGVERDQFGGFYRNSKSVHEQGRFTTFAYPDEGPSNYKLSSFYGHGEPMKNHDELDLDGRYKVEYLEQDRAELLRKLDELKDQLSRSYDIEEKPRERVPVDRKMPPPDPYGDRVTYSVSMQPSAPDKPIQRPPYFNYSHGPGPFMNYHDIDMQKFYFPPKHVPNEIPGYEDPFQAQMMRRPPHQPPPQYAQRPPHDYFSGHYMDFNQDPLAYYPQETFFHQPACSCLCCCNKNRQAPPQVPPAVFGNGRFPNPINSNFNNNVNPVTFGPGYNPRGSNPPLHSRDPQPHTRWPSDLDSDIDGIRRSRPRRGVVAHGNKQFFHPIAGGAPFITCYNCFELLKLPRKLKMMEKNQQKLQCGACSTVILFKSDNKRIIISVPMESKGISAKDNDGSCEALNDSLLSSHGCLNDGGTNSCSEDFDNSCYDRQLQDIKHSFLSEDHRLNLSESGKRQGVSSSSSIYSEEEESPDSVIVSGDVSNLAELPSKDDLSPGLLGSPFPEHFDDVSSNHGVSRYGKGNKSKRTDQENVILNKKASRQNSVNDASLATEVEVSFNEYLNTSLSQGSVDVSKEDQSRINKGSESFLVGLIKKGFRDLSKSNQTVENEECNVSVNGQPIPDRVVKRAEKQAGPIQPGDYWYDFRGGFWGVMGQPCQGIIPPFIDEFNYPMPTNCAAGSTCVYVNGRELHQKDFDLLARRGLPTTRDKFYIIEISGRVVDEDSGEELETLGKLAPTVEKAKHGFGMRVRKVVA